MKECRANDKTAPGNRANVRQGQGQRLDDSGMYLMDNGMYQYPRGRGQGPQNPNGQYRNGHPQQQEYDEGELQEDEHEIEYTINDEINPDDMIRTMEPAQIEKFIPKKKFDQIAKNNKSVEDNTCTICIDFLKNGEMLREIPICRHAFHAECLLSWLQVNEVCPNCKNEVSIFTLRAYFESIRQTKKDSPKKKEEKVKGDQSGPQANQAGNAPGNQTSLEVIHTRFTPSAIPNPNLQRSQRNASRVNIQDRSEPAGLDWNAPAFQLDESHSNNRSFNRRR